MLLISKGSVLHNFSELRNYFLWTSSSKSHANLCRELCPCYLLPVARNSLVSNVFFKYMPAIAVFSQNYRKVIQKAERERERHEPFIR
ncbi:unnamed protein product [Coffea canephora]|uniref:Uncharacterized protein n=1 Tax=Coffea canephora TaxID=49390 RepID=A0A068V9U5_COFCA|nr:unnamed protein product [Coffea canephora]